MIIRVVSSILDFMKLKNLWDELAEDLVTVNKFDWMFKWWNYYQNNKNLNIVVAELDGKIVGIAPLYIDNKPAVKYIPFKRVGFLGGNLSDYQDFIIDPEQDRETVFKALFDFMINDLDYDFLYLRHINSHYPNFHLWQKYAGMRMTPYIKCPKVRLTDFSSYNEYFNQLSRNLRRSLKYRQKKVEKDNSIVEYVFKKNITKQDIDIVADINYKRQEFLYNKGEKDRWCYFADRTKRHFIEDFFINGDPETRLLVYVKINGNIAAYDLVLVNNNTISLWNGAFLPEYDEYSPTKLEINELIRYSFENNYKYFDLMRGNTPYKLQWTNDESVNYTLTYHKSLKSSIVSIYREKIAKILSYKTGNAEILKSFTDS